MQELKQVKWSGNATLFLSILLRIICEPHKFGYKDTSIYSMSIPLE